MIQNRNKLIELFIGNLSNAVVHKILEKAIENELMKRISRGYYNIDLNMIDRVVDTTLMDLNISFVNAKFVIFTMTVLSVDEMLSLLNISFKESSS